ncbi:MAG: DUF2950 domain-containing protein [Planctomycetes bacterium]|nr:DUF2950 domain-containing protein [Planctomycetota bacterium]
MDTPTPAARRPISTLALVAAATAILALPLVPALVGTAALSDIRLSEGARRGRRLAIAAVALGIFWFVAEGALAAALILKPEFLFTRLYRERIEHGHVSAVRALSIVAQQQELLRREDEDGNAVHDYWSTDIAWLYRIAMEKKGRPDIMGLDVAGADAAAADGTRPTPRDGYLLRTVPGVDRLTQYAATAYPASYGVDGLRTFYIDERGIVWSRDIGGGPALQRIDEPEAQGWKREDAP